MKEPFYNILSGASAAVFGVLLLLSVVSFFGLGDTWLWYADRWNIGRSEYGIDIRQGIVDFSIAGPYPRTHWNDKDAVCTMTGGGVWPGLPGIHGQTTSYRYDSPADGIFATEYRQVYVAAVYPLLLLAILPMWRLGLILKRRRERMKRGFDVIATEPGTIQS